MKKIVSALLLLAFSMSVSVATQAQDKQVVQDQQFKITAMKDVSHSFHIVAIMPNYMDVAVVELPVVLTPEFYAVELKVVLTDVAPVSRCRGPTRYSKCLS